jgi:hypothetical protein
MKNDVSKVCFDLQQVADDASSTFGSLSAEQVNWKPAPKSWSIAQCFDHLITTHSLYFPLFERLASGNATQTFWESYSPLSGFFGRFLIKSLRPENVKPMKTTSKAQPSTSEIDSDIIERYCKHQRQMVETIQRIPTNIDPSKTIITSPLLGLVTYSLEDCYEIIAVHGPRHFNQAKRVMGTHGFPERVMSA